VGIGGRGSMLMKILLDLEGVQVKAVCDIIEDRVKHAQRWVKAKGQPEPAGYSRGDRDYERLCEKEDLDLVITATPEELHTPICIAAMKNGKHCATEVGATYKLDECWQLVETAEKYNRHCALLENYCYFYNVMMVLKMVRAGLFGDLIHAEAGYQHDVRNVRFGSDGTLLWRAQDLAHRNGNLYPTHAVGPVCQWMNINRGDRFDYLVSMCSKEMGMHNYAVEHFGPNSPAAKQKYAQGDVSTTLIRTVNGLTIMLYYDSSSPRPFDMIYRVQGSKGIYMDSMGKMYLEGKSPQDTWEPIDKYAKDYVHPLWKALGDKAASTGHGGSDYIVMYRLIQALRNGTPPDIDVYDTATWSAISPLSEVSVAHKSQPQDFPDFTRGKWKTMQPLGIIEA
jgi:hypothetical protein